MTPTQTAPTPPIRVSEESRQLKEWRTPVVVLGDMRTAEQSGSGRDDSEFFLS